MKDLTIIIPVKEYEPSMDKLINRAIESCADNKIILVGKCVEKYKFQTDDEMAVQPSLTYLENTSDNLKLISTKDSQIPVYVIPTDEELMIARKTLKIVSEM